MNTDANNTVRKNLLPELNKVRSRSPTPEKIQKSLDWMIGETKKDSCWTRGIELWQQRQKYQDKIVHTWSMYPVPRDYLYRRLYDNNGIKIQYWKWCDCVECKPVTNN